MPVGADELIHTLSPKVRRHTMRAARLVRRAGEGDHCSLCSRLQLIQVLATGKTATRYKLKITRTILLQDHMACVRFITQLVHKVDSEVCAE